MSNYKKIRFETGKSLFSSDGGCILNCLNMSQSCPETLLMYLNRHRRVQKSLKFFVIAANMFLCRGAPRTAQTSNYRRKLSLTSRSAHAQSTSEVSLPLTLTHTEAKSSNKRGGREEL